jgi:2-polyprenyl-6-hydroxyphenyl methylase/3-demethylubiquinone-9 3-methyltransferase
LPPTNFLSAALVRLGLSRQTTAIPPAEPFPIIRPDAAAIEVGGDGFWAAVPPGRDGQTVRPFGTDPAGLAEWLIRCGIRTVAAESPADAPAALLRLRDLLESRGLVIILVDPEAIPTPAEADGRLCQWLQKLHSCGLLPPSRPTTEPPLLQPACAPRAPCKCCGGAAVLYGVVDFQKNCRDAPGELTGLRGVPVYYYRCRECRFLFTTAFDGFSVADFRRHVYNEEYPLLDPDYQEVRPRGNANWLCDLFSAGRPRRVLDYGGGNGALADLLRAAGFPHADTYDPYVPRHAARPQPGYDCVVSFEVLEHSTDPRRTLADIGQFLADPGLVVFSTLLQPDDIDRHRLDWWYAGPRNGHVSLFTRESLEKLAGLLGFTLASFNEDRHLLFRELPDFAKPFVQIV